MRAVLHQTLLVVPHHLLKHSQVAPPDSLGNGQVGRQLGPHLFVEKDLAVGDFSHEQLDDDKEPLRGNAKTQSRLGRRFLETLA